MKNYSELSDFEINSAVHNATMTNPYKIEFLGNNKIRWIRGETDAITDMVPYGKTTLRDYCNNPSDAWPIINGNEISLIQAAQFTGWVAVSGLTLNGHSQYIDERLDNCIKHQHCNGLRAAMIVYLVMKDNENA